MIPVFDSNIVIDITYGYEKAIQELKKYEKVAISIVTWIEVMAGAKNEDQEKRLATSLLSFELAYLDINVSYLASCLRRQHRLKLPDAIIWATAQSRNTLLVTRNSRDFPKDDPAIRIPYTL